MFSESELAFLKSQPLARLGTVATDGQVDVDAVGFEFDGRRFYIGGRNLPGTRKYKNIAAGNTKVSLMIDDLKTIQPWEPRGIKIHGTAELVERNGMFGPAPYIVVTPTTSWSWGIEGDQFQNGKFVPKKIVWQ